MWDSQSSELFSDSDIREDPNVDGLRPVAFGSVAAIVAATVAAGLVVNNALNPCSTILRPMDDPTPNPTPSNTVFTIDVDGGWGVGFGGGGVGFGGGGVGVGVFSGGKRVVCVWFLR